MPPGDALGRSPLPGERFLVAPGSESLIGTGPPRRFTVEVERGIPVAATALAAFVERVLGDRGGCGARGRAAFRRVAGGPVNFRVVLALPRTTDRLAPLRNGIFSCFMGGRAVLNFHRWRHGAATYGRDRRGYRVYLVNHELGHALGYRHASCAASGRPAPVMAQQTKGVAPCTPNPWPRPSRQR